MTSSMPLSLAIWMWCGADAARRSPAMWRATVQRAAPGQLIKQGIGHLKI